MSLIVWVNQPWKILIVERVLEVRLTLTQSWEER